MIYGIPVYANLATRVIPMLVPYNIFPAHLKNLPLDKMSTISQMAFSYASSWIKKFDFWHVPKGRIDNNPELI